MVRFGYYSALVLWVPLTSVGRLGPLNRTYRLSLTVSHQTASNFAHATLHHWVDWTTFGYCFACNIRNRVHNLDYRGSVLGVVVIYTYGVWNPLVADWHRIGCSSSAPILVFGVPSSTFLDLLVRIVWTIADVYTKWNHDIILIATNPTRSYQYDIMISLRPGAENAPA